VTFGDGGQNAGASPNRRPAARLRNQTPRSPTAADQQAFRPGRARLVGRHGCRDVLRLPQQAARGPFGYFLGEYEALTNIGNSFFPVFVAVNNGNPANRTDVFSTTAG
jgi:hypothetical protein